MNDKLIKERLKQVMEEMADDFDCPEIAQMDDEYMISLLNKHDLFIIDVESF